MAYHPQPDASPFHGSVPDDDVPPPPPAHRLPVARQPGSPYQQRQYQDPNQYSDYSTPGSSDHINDGPVNGIDGWSRNGSSHSNGAIPRPMYSPRSYGSGAPLAPGAIAPTGAYSSDSSMHSIPPPAPQGVPYSDSPYNRYSSSNLDFNNNMGHIDPNDVADDDDWGMGPTTTQNKRRSFLPVGGSRDDSRNPSPGSSINAGVAGAAVAGGAYAVTRDGSGKYNAVPHVSGSNGSNPELLTEKADWRAKDDLKKRKKRMWIAIAIIAIILLGAILGGVLGAFLSKSGGGKDSSSSGTSANDVAADNKNDLGKDSSEIKALMNNANLHKVFPGMDYTPLNAQYPDCLHVGPSQNNITRDMAVMSQLTNTVRLYGTDCNQTQMLIHAIDRLDIKDSMKIWLGVWLDSNDTTTSRQIDQTWQVLDDYGCDYFKGIIIGNEVLYRKDLTATQLLGHVTDFKKNITDHKCKLPVAMADLGDNWTADMASKVDYVMSNVHPFFAGQLANASAAWTYNFWQDHDVKLTADNTTIKQVIAEVGWPSAGGKNCGESPTCDSSTPGAVAGISEMNQFMQDWVCPSLKNGTEYFWFSAFDEPWKIRYNTKGKEWEDKWGLMDIDRKLKSGLKIPDCNGQSLPSS